MTDEKKPPLEVGCTGSAALSGQLEPALVSAVFTDEACLFEADDGKCGVRSVAGAAQPGAAASVAAVGGMRIGERLRQAAAIGKCHLYLFYFRVRRLELGVRIIVAELKCRLFGLQEPKVLLKNRRTAVLVDKFFERVKKAHKVSPV